MCFSKLFSLSKFFCVCSATPFPDSGILYINHISLARVMKNMFFSPAWQTSGVICLHKWKVCAKMFHWSCRWMRHTIPGISLKKTGGTFTRWIPVVSWIQRIISTQATERDSGVMRIFQDGYFLLCWVSTSFHYFSAAATIIKRRKKRKQLSGDICPYVVLIFVFTLLYSTL